MQKRKPSLSPQAAKILEQYQNAGKNPAAGTEPNGTVPESGTQSKNGAALLREMRRCDAVVHVENRLDKKAKARSNVLAFCF